MVKVLEQDGGFLIENKVLYGADVPNDQYINLGKEPGDEMRYEKLPYTLIDFPGEYDISGLQIKVLLGKNNLLNYILYIKNAVIGLIQSADVLNDDELPDADVRLYSDDKIAHKIDQLELEGDKKKLGTEE